MTASKTILFFTRFVYQNGFKFVLPLQILLYLIFLLQALKEAFEVFCNKGVAGSSSAELLATFCDNILKKGGSEKLSDEAIEDTLEKVCCAVGCYSFCLTCTDVCNCVIEFLINMQVVKLLAYISDKDLFAEFYRYLSSKNAYQFSFGYFLSLIGVGDGYFIATFENRRNR